MNTWHLQILSSAAKCLGMSSPHFDEFFSVYLEFDDDFFVISRVPRWYFYAIFRVPRWFFYVISIVLRWFFYVISRVPRWFFLCHLQNSNMIFFMPSAEFHNDFFHLQISTMIFLVFSRFLRWYFFVISIISPWFFYAILRIPQSSCILSSPEFHEVPCIALFFRINIT